jgi:hypothetical protein
MLSGKKFILGVTDEFSIFAELVTKPDKKATKLGSALFSRWLCRKGLPIEIETVSNNGK